MDVNLKNVKVLRDYICKGCMTYIVSGDKGRIITVCHAPHKKNGRVCPCSACLIKSMCKSSCDKFDIYAGVIGYNPKDIKNQAVRVVDYQTKPDGYLLSKDARLKIA